MSQDNTPKLPLKRRIRVAVDVEISVYDIHVLAQDREDVRVLKAAERALLHSLLASPEELTRYLRLQALLEVASTDQLVYQKLVYGHETKDYEFLTPAGERLDREAQDLISPGDEWDFSELSAFPHVFRGKIVGVEMEEIAKRPTRSPKTG